MAQTKFASINVIDLNVHDSRRQKVTAFAQCVLGNPSSTDRDWTGSMTDKKRTHTLDPTCHPRMSIEQKHTSQLGTSKNLTLTFAIPIDDYSAPFSTIHPRTIDWSMSKSGRRRTASGSNMSASKERHDTGERTGKRGSSRSTTAIFDNNWRFTKCDTTQLSTRNDVWFQNTRAMPIYAPTCQHRQHWAQLLNFRVMPLSTCMLQMNPATVQNASTCCLFDSNMSVENAKQDARESALRNCLGVDRI